MLIDTHCHLDFPQFDEDRNKVITNARTNGVTKMVTIGCHTNTLQKTIDIANKYDGVFAGIGIHPCDVSTDPEKEAHIVREYAENPLVVAIGETGLDFFREENPSQDVQEYSFAQHVHLAKEYQKPVIVHLRNARKEAQGFFEKHHDFPFVIHCFSEDWDFGKMILDAGGMLSFTGTVTFKNTPSSTQEMLKKIPLNRMMVETDSPFLAPVPQRGKRNEPAYVRHVAEYIADLRDIPYEEFCAQMTQNAEEFFGI